MSAHDLLKQEEQKLTDIDNKTAEFTQLTHHFSQYSQLSEIESQFVDFYLYLNSEIKVTNANVSASATKIKDFQIELKPIADEIKLLGQNLFTANRNSEQAKKNIAKTEKDIDTAEVELSLYGEMSAQEVLEVLDEEFTTTQDKVKALQDENARLGRIQSLQQRITEYQAKQGVIETEMANSQFAIDKQLSNETLTLLHSVNPKLVMANPGRSLTQHEWDSLEHFKNLFVDQGYLYNFWGQEFSKSSSRTVRNLALELDDIKSEISADTAEKNALEQQDTENPLITAKKLEALNKELKEIARVKGLINELANNRSGLNIYKKQLTESQAELAEHTPRLETLKAKQSELAELIEAEKQSKQSLAAEQSRLLELQSKSDGTKQAYAKIQRQLERQDTFNQQPSLTAEHLSSLQRDLQQVEGLRTNIIESLRDFARAGFIEADTELFNSSPLPSVIHQSYLNLKQIYDELDGQRLLLKTKTKSHNESVSNYVDILDKTLNTLAALKSNSIVRLKEFQ